MAVPKAAWLAVNSADSMAHWMAACLEHLAAGNSVAWLAMSMAVRRVANLVAWTAQLWADSWADQMDVPTVDGWACSLVGQSGALKVALKALKRAEHLAADLVLEMAVKLDIRLAEGSASPKVESWDTLRVDMRVVLKVSSKAVHWVRYLAALLGVQKAACSVPLMVDWKAARWEPWLVDDWAFRWAVWKVI